MSPLQQKVNYIHFLLHYRRTESKAIWIQYFKTFFNNVKILVLFIELLLHHAQILFKKKEIKSYPELLWRKPY